MQKYSIGIFNIHTQFHNILLLIYMFKEFNKILVHIDLAPIYLARQLIHFAKLIN